MSIAKRREMNTTLQVYQFKENPVRIEVDEKGEPWFVAKDVCKILHIANTTRAISGLDSDEKGLHSMNTPGGMQIMSMITEAAVYKLTMLSRKSEAKEFQRWVTHDVLPSIRKTGSYSVKPLSQIDILQQSLDILRDHQNALDDLNNRVCNLENKPAQLTAPVKPLSLRAQINMVIRDYAQTHGKDKEDYRRYYNNLYEQFYYRNHIIDLRRRAHTLHCRKLDVASEIGVLSDLHSLAVSMFA